MKDKKVSKDEKKRFLSGEGYLKIIQNPIKYASDGKTMVKVEETIYLCVMCGKKGLYVIPETNEVLCYKCLLNNNEARTKCLNHLPKH